MSMIMGERIGCSFEAILDGLKKEAESQ